MKDEAIARNVGLSSSSVIPHPSSFHLKIADFGIGGLAAAASLAQNATLRSSGGVLVSQLQGSHTPLYASPQQQTGLPPDPRDDVHALGVIGFQMLTGKLDATLGADYARTLRRFAVPEPLIELLGDCAAHDADHRPRDAAELAEKLATLASAPTTPGVARELAAPPVPPPSPQPEARSTSLGVATVKMVGCLCMTGVLVGGLVGSAYLLMEPFVGPSPRLDAPTPAVERRFTFPQKVQLKGAIADVSYTSDSRRIVIGTDTGDTAFYDAEFGTYQCEISGTPAGPVPTSPRSRPVLSRDAQRMATLTANGEIQIWDTATGIREGLPLVGFGEKVGVVAFTADGSKVIAGGDETGAFKALDISSRKVSQLTTEPPHGGPISTIAVDRTGRYVATSSDRMQMFALWDVLDGFTRKVTGTGRNPAFSPDGKWLIVRVADGLHAHDVRQAATSGKDDPTTKLAFGPMRFGDIRRIVFSPANNWVALLTGTERGSFGVWEQNLGGRPWPEESNADRTGVTTAAFDTSGKLLVTGHPDGTIRIWETTNKNLRFRLPAHGDGITGIAFSPTGRRMVTLSRDGEAKVWEVPEMPPGTMGPINLSAN